MKKYLTIGIILLFIGTCIIPATATPVNQSENRVSQPWGFFGLKSNFEITWDANQTEEPIIPRGPIRQVELVVEFWVTWGIFGRLINYLLKYQPVIMKLSMVEKPEWCTAIISQENLSFTIPRKENVPVMIHDFLAVTVNDDAPAFELFPVTFQVTMESVRGPLGLFTMMQGTTQRVNVTFTVAYKPLIQPQFPEGNIIETPPLVQVELPIGITNLGNGRTIVKNEVVNCPDSWIVALPTELILDVDEYKEMNLSIIAPFDFYYEITITVSFTPHSFDNYSLVGTTTYATFLAYYNPP